MEKQLVIIQGHPDPAGNRLCHALADEYAAGARSVGASVNRVEVSQLDFPLLRTSRDFQAGKKNTPKSLIPAQEAILAADHVTIVYPLWLGTMPALLKGFLEQVLRPGVALDESEEIPKPLMNGTSARIVITMGMPALAYRWYFRAHSLKSLERNVLAFCGISPIRENLFGMVETASNKKRTAWLAKMRNAGRHDAR